MPPVSLAAVLTHWSFEPTIVAGVIVLAVGFVYLQREPELATTTGGRVAFTVGLFTLAVALLSPLDELSDQYLLTAHMIQHLLLVLLAAPLLVYGMPTPWAARIRIHPGLAFLLFNFVFVFSHVPAWYNATLEHESLHVIEHLAYLVTAAANWLPILSPARERRLSQPLQMLYLFFETLPMFLVGSLLAMGTTAIYPFYLRAPRIVDMTAVQDQSLAGLIMWIGCSFFYLGALTIVFFKWASREIGLDDLPESMTGMRNPEPKDLPSAV